MPVQAPPNNPIQQRHRNRKPTGARQLYWLGLRRSHDESHGPGWLAGVPCPFTSLTLGGVTFHLYTEKVEGEGIDTVRTRVQGGYAWLDGEDLEAIKRDLDRYRVAWLARDGEGKPLIFSHAIFRDQGGKQVKGKLVDVGARGYNPQPYDCKLNGWIYMKPVDAATLYEPPDPPAGLQGPNEDDWDMDSEEDFDRELGRIEDGGPAVPDQPKVETVEDAKLAKSKTTKKSSSKGKSQSK